MREDRILHEARATGGDVRRICDLFGLTVEAAVRYLPAPSSPTSNPLTQRGGRGFAYPPPGTHPLQPARRITVTPMNAWAITSAILGGLLLLWLTLVLTLWYVAHREGRRVVCATCLRSSQTSCTSSRLARDPTLPRGVRIRSSPARLPGLPHRPHTRLHPDRRVHRRHRAGRSGPEVRCRRAGPRPSTGTGRAHPRAPRHQRLTGYSHQVQ